MPFEPFQPVNDPSKPGYDWRQMDNVPPRQQPYFQPDSLHQASHAWKKWRTIGVGIASGKAAKNVYNETGDLGEAAQVGVLAYMRWTVWVISLVWSFLLGLWFCVCVNEAFRPGGLSTTNHFGSTCAAILALLSTISIWPFAFGVTWCRNVDFCLFRQGMWYKLFKPVADACDSVSLIVLHLLTLFPVCMLYNLIKAMR